MESKNIEDDLLNLGVLAYLKKKNYGKAYDELSKETKKVRIIFIR
jgi:hypothetical protein